MPALFRSIGRRQRRERATRSGPNMAEDSHSMRSSLTACGSEPFANEHRRRRAGVQACLSPLNSVASNTLATSASPAPVRNAARGETSVQIAPNSRLAARAPNPIAPL